MRKLVLSLLFIIPSISHAQLMLNSVKVLMVGSYPASSSTAQAVAGIYVLPSSNPDNCLYGGVLFNDTLRKKEALAIALTAKATNALVRLDYTKMADGSCNGYSIYII